MLSQYVRMSVRPSVTYQHCVETAEHILKLFSPAGDTPLFRRDPLTEGVECAEPGYEKIAIFDQYFALSRK